MQIKYIIKKGLKGFSIYRIMYLMKIKTLKIKLNGSILDLASGNEKNPEYLNYLKSKKTKIMRTDLIKNKNIDYVVDLNKKFDLKTATFDNVCFFNSLMYVKNYKLCLKEIYRVLKKDGTFIGTSNLIFGISYEPIDYWRFTQDNLKEIFEEIGYKKIEIYPIGGHFTSAFFLIREFFYFKIIKITISLICFYLDKIGNNLNKKNPCPTGYLYICKK